MKIAALGFRRTFRRLGAAAFFAAAAGAAAASTWVMHGGATYVPVTVVNQGAANTVNLCATNACASGGLTTGGTAVIAVTGTSTTVNTAGAAGSQTQTVTNSNAQTVSNLTFTPSFGGGVSSPLTLTSLSSAPVTSSFCTGSGCTTGSYYLGYDKYSFVVTPSAAGNTVTVTATRASLAACFTSCLDTPTTTTASLTLDVPATPSGSTASKTSAGVLPKVPSSPPVKGPPPAPVAFASATPDLTAQEAQAAIEKCGIEVPSCVADALDAYANHLDAIADKLPASMRGLPRTIHEAARRVREAKTPAAAIKAIKAAIAQVKVSVTLIRAVDSDAAAFGRNEGAQAVNVLNAAQVALTRVSGL